MRGRSALFRVALAAAMLAGLLLSAPPPATANHLEVTVTVTAGNGSLHVRWIRDNPAGNQLRWRVKNPQGQWQQIGTDVLGQWCPSSGCTYTIRNLVNETVYEVQVGARIGHLHWSALHEGTPSISAASSDATLGSLTASVTSDLSSYRQLALSGGGDSGYEARAPGDAAYVRLRPVASDPGATITVTTPGRAGRAFRLGSGQSSDGAFPVRRGEDPHALRAPREETRPEAALFRLDVLHNHIRIRVTAEDATTTKDYWVMIFRMVPEAWKDAGCAVGQDDDKCPPKRPNSLRVWGSSAAESVAEASSTVRPGPQPDTGPAVPTTPTWHASDYDRGPVTVAITRPQTQPDTEPQPPETPGPITRPQTQPDTEPQPPETPQPATPPRPQPDTEPQPAPQPLETSRPITRRLGPQPDTGPQPVPQPAGTHEPATRPEPQPGAGRLTFAPSLDG